MNNFSQANTLQHFDSHRLIMLSSSFDSLFDHAGCGWRIDGQELHGFLVKSVGNQSNLF